MTIRKILPETDDMARRVAAQTVLALLPIEIRDVAHIEVEDLPDGENVALRVVIVKTIPLGRRPIIIAGWDLSPREETVKSWPQSVVDEYRRQYNPTPTGSFGIRLGVHPDQVDLWRSE